MTQTFDRDTETFPFTEIEWAQMMMLTFEKYDVMHEYEAQQPKNAIFTIMNPEPTSLQEALDVIRKKDLKIEQMQREIKELKDEVKEQQKLLG